MTSDNPQGKGVHRDGRGSVRPFLGMKFAGYWWPVPKKPSGCACCAMGLFPGHVEPRDWTKA